MKKETKGFKCGVCPSCGTNGEFYDERYMNFIWDGKELFEYFTCPKCGGSYRDCYTVSYNFTEFKEDADFTAWINELNEDDE